MADRLNPSLDILERSADVSANAHACHPLPSGLISEEHLKAWTGYKQRTALESRLRELRIPYAHGAGGKIITTLDAVTAALAGQPGAKMESDSIEFE